MEVTDQLHEEYQLSSIMGQGGGVWSLSVLSEEEKNLLSLLAGTETRLFGRAANNLVLIPTKRR